MSKSKSVFVTALVAVMLAAIVAGLYLMHYKAWAIIAGVMAVYGYLCASVAFCRWLVREPPLLPAHLSKDDKVEEPPIDFSELQDIIDEMQKEAVQA